jgi:two-component system, cell cycle sensor histidine kinase and response regulator CckA
MLVSSPADMTVARQLSGDSPALLVVTPDGTIVGANPAACTLYGYSADEFLQRTWSDVSGETTPESTQADVAGHAASPHVAGHRRKDGTTLGVVVSGTCIATGPAAGLHVLAITDTSRRTSDHADERARAILNVIPDLVFRLNRDGVFLDFKADVRDMYYRDSSPLIGQRCRDLMPPPFTDLIDGQIAATLATGDVQTFEYRLEIPERGPRDYEARMVQCGADEVVTFVHDVTERKQRIEALRENEARFRSYFELPHVGFAVTAPDASWLRVNSTLCRTLGYTEDELRARTWKGLTHPDDLAADVSLFEKVADGTIENYTLEKRFIRKDGSTLPAQISVGCVRKPDRSVQYFMVLLLDISKRKQAEAERESLQAQLQQAQKLESVGRLAGGVAHDFNNILSAMLMQLSLMRDDTALGDTTRAAVAELDREASRAAELTRQLLMFSRHSVLTLKPVDVNAVVTGLLKMLGRLIEAHISLGFNAGHDLPRVLADTGLLEQVVMNLVVNARDATPAGGCITIATRTIEACAISSGHGDGQDAPSGPFVCLEVADTGCGMDPATVSQAFEPFFTTKASGQGTGLGLSTVHGIVAQHLGWVDIQSAVGVGTTVSVYLPAIQTRTADLSDAPDAAPIRGGTETILLVEDEEAVRNLMGGVLRQLGYRVIEAGSGIDALRAWQASRGHIHLLLTDAVLPAGMDGQELATLIVTAEPHVKVIAISGYGTDTVDPTAFDKPGFVFLPKPVAPATLAAAVRRLLDEGVAPATSAS